MHEKRRFNIGIAAIVGLLFGVCAILFGRALSSTKPDYESAIARQRSKVRNALARGDATAYASVYGERAVVRARDGSELVGRAAIAAAIRSTFDRAAIIPGSSSRQLTPRGNDMVLENGRYAFTALVRDEPMAFAGAYVSVWHLSKSQWEIAFEAVRSERLS